MNPLGGLRRRPVPHHDHSTTGKENQPLAARPQLGVKKLDSLLQPSPQIPFPQWQRRQPLRARFVNRQQQQGDAPQTPAINQPRAEVGQEENDAVQEEPSWLLNVRKEIWMQLRREAEQEQQQQQRPVQFKQEPRHHATPTPTPTPAQQQHRRATEIPLPPSQSTSPASAADAPPLRSAFQQRRRRPPPSRPHSPPSPPASLSPISTFNLPPIRRPLRSGGSIEILPTLGREVLLDLRARGNSEVVLLFSGDGEQISLFHQPASMTPLVLLHPEAVYTRITLPLEFGKSYSLARRFLEGVRSKVPKMSLKILYSPTPAARSTERLHPAKLTIYSDAPPSPSFAISLPSPTSTPPARLTIRIDRPRQLLLVRSSAGGQALSFPLPLDDTAVPSELRDAVRWALEQEGLVRRLMGALEVSAEGAGRRTREEGRQDPPNPQLAGGRTRVGEGSPSREEELERPEQKQKQEEQEEPVERRHLLGAGWIVRRRIRELAGASRHGWRYEVLFGDGAELELEEAEGEESARARMRPSGSGGGGGRWGPWTSIAEARPRVKQRLELVQEMVALF